MRRRAGLADDVKTWLAIATAVAAGVLLAKVVWFSVVLERMP